MMQASTEYHRERKKRLKEAGLCCICRQPRTNKSKAFCDRHLEKHREYERERKRIKKELQIKEEQESKLQHAKSKSIEAARKMGLY